MAPTGRGARLFGVEALVPRAPPRRRARAHVVDLDVDPATLADRLESRIGHFATADLLPSQLATLELSDDVVRVRATGTPDEVADLVVRSVSHP